MIRDESGQRRGAREVPGLRLGRRFERFASAGARDADPNGPGRATIVCEPSLVRSTTRASDIVLICPVSGVSAIAVKGFGLDQIDGIDPGGRFVVRYSNGAIGRNPFAQVRNAMFAVKDAAARTSGRDPSFGT